MMQAESNIYCRTLKSRAQAVPVAAAFVLSSYCVQDVPTHAKVLLVEG